MDARGSFRAVTYAARNQRCESECNWLSVFLLTSKSEENSSAENVTKMQGYS